MAAALHPGDGRGRQGQELLNLVATAAVHRDEPAAGKYTGAPLDGCLRLQHGRGDLPGAGGQSGRRCRLRAAQDRFREKVDEWIPIILAAQTEDGYIHSFQSVNGHPRYSNIAWHEFYVMGYFLEMGVAHYRMTDGKDRRLYDAAVRCG